MQNLGRTSLGSFPSVHRNKIVKVSPHRFCVPSLIRPAYRRATFPQGKAIRCYTMLSSQQSGAVRPIIFTMVGATLARP